MYSEKYSLINAFRQVHLDFHTSPLIPDVGSEFNSEKFAEILRRASVNSITVFAKCHHGMSYYDTKVGVKHPSLKFDLLREMVNVCHNNDIRIVAYYSVCWDAYMGDEHPEWLQIDKNGMPVRPKPFERPYFSWETLCLNSPYVDYVKDQIKEILKNYDIDGVFFDIVWQIRPGCICKNCRISMEKLGLDYSNDEDLRKHSRMIEERFMKTMYDLVIKLKPSASIYFNGTSNMNIGRMAEKYMTHFEIESLPTGFWGYYHFPFYARYFKNFGKTIVGMTGRFHIAWADFGGLKNDIQLKYEVARILAHGGLISIGDQLHPHGALDRAVYEVIGKAYSLCKNVEDWIKGSNPIYEAAILVLPRSRSIDQFLFGERSFELDDTLAGVTKLLMEEKIQFNIIDHLMDFNRYDLLIIPDYGLVDDETHDKLREYLKRGGKIIFSYRATFEDGQFACPGIELEYVEADKYDVDYIRVAPKIGEDIPLDFDIAMYDSGIYANCKGCKELAKIREPYFRRTYKAFTSHCYSPVAKDSPYPAVALAENEQVLYIYSPIFASYYKYGYGVYRKLVRNCINLLLPNRLVMADAPITSEILLTNKDNLKLLHIVNYQPARVGRHPEYMENYYPIKGMSVKVKAEKEPKRIYSAINRKEIPYKFLEGYLEIAVQKTNVYELIVIED